MPAMFILNPYANRWQVGQRKDEALAALRATGVHTELRLTEPPSPGTEPAPEEAAALQPALARYGVAEATNGTQFGKKARLLATAAIGVVLLPPAPPDTTDDDTCPHPAHGRGGRSGHPCCGVWTSAPSRPPSGTARLLVA